MKVFELNKITLVFLAIFSTSIYAENFQETNRITVRGRVEIHYVITEGDVLIPIKDDRLGYISLDLEGVNRDQVQIHTEPAKGMRLAFREFETPADVQRSGRVNWFGEVVLDDDGRFELELDLDTQLPVAYRPKRNPADAAKAELDDKVETLYMVLRGGIRSEKLRHEGYSVLGFHELDIEEDKRLYEVDIAFQALLPNRFPGLVFIEEIEKGEGINPSVRYEARLNGNVISSGKEDCDNDGSFVMTILPIEGVEIEARVLGLNYLELNYQTMRKNWTLLHEIMEKSFIIKIQETPPAAIIFEVNIVDSSGNYLDLDIFERSGFYIGLMKEGVKTRDVDYNYHDIELWTSAGVDTVHVWWNIPPGKKTLVARYGMVPRKIIPQAIEIKDLDEEDRPQMINVQIIHEP